MLDAEKRAILKKVRWQFSNARQVGLDAAAPGTAATKDKRSDKIAPSFFLPLETNGAIVFDSLSQVDGFCEYEDGSQIDC